MYAPCIAITFSVVTFFFALYLCFNISFVVVFFVFWFFSECVFLRLRCLLPNCDAMTGATVHTWILLCRFWYLIWLRHDLDCLLACLLAYWWWWWWWWWRMEGTQQPCIYYSLLHIASNPWEKFSTLSNYYCCLKPFIFFWVLFLWALCIEISCCNQINPVPFFTLTLHRIASHRHTWCHAIN